MPPSTKQRRVEKIERQLSPRQWAIRLADEVRRYSSGREFLEAVAKTAYREWPTLAPFYALTDQTSERFPGKRSENVQARNNLGRTLRTQFCFYRRLFFSVNEAIASKTTALESTTALTLARLQTLVLQDAFARTARKAAAWVEENKATDAEEEERQVILKELASYPNWSFGEKRADAVPLGPGPVRFRSLIEGLADKLTILGLDVFAQKAAVRAIEGRYFDDHRILSRDVEAKLEETIQMVEGAVATFNEYLKHRSELYKERGDERDQGGAGAFATPDGREARLVVEIDAIQKRAGGALADAIADEWAKEAKERVISDSLEETGDHEDYVVQSLRRRLGMKV